MLEIRTVNHRVYQTVIPWAGASSQVVDEDTQPCPMWVRRDSSRDLFFLPKIMVGADPAQPCAVMDRSVAQCTATLQDIEAMRSKLWTAKPVGAVMPQSVRAGLAIGIGTGGSAAACMAWWGVLPWMWPWALSLGMLAGAAGCFFNRGNLRTAQDFDSAVWELSQLAASARRVESTSDQLRDGLDALRSQYDDLGPAFHILVDRMAHLLGQQP